MDKNSTRGNGSLEDGPTSCDSSRSTEPDVDSPRTMFSPRPDGWEETRKAERKRIAVWGIATGGVMAAVLALCVLLAYLASSA